MQIRDQNGLTEQEFLSQYNQGDYPRPSVAVDMVIFTVANTPIYNNRKLAEKELRLLLIQRGGHPYLGKWALPGGFVRPTETVSQAAARELREETGMESNHLEQLCIFSEPERDPRTWVMSAAHMALVDSFNIKLRAGDDASDAKWFRLSYDLLKEEKHMTGRYFTEYQQYQLQLTDDETELTAIIEQISRDGTIEFKIIQNDGLAFDHAKIIACALQRLRGNIEDSGLVFNLMPEKFTLSELQQVYEVILNKPLLKAAFRRKIKHLVHETGEYTENAGHRPSQLFQRYQER